MSSPTPPDVPEDKEAVNTPLAGSRRGRSLPTASLVPSPTGDHQEAASTTGDGDTSMDTPSDEAGGNKKPRRTTDAIKELWHADYKEYQVDKRGSSYYVYCKWCVAYYNKRYKQQLNAGTWFFPPMPSKIRLRQKEMERHNNKCKHRAEYYNHPGAYRDDDFSEPKAPPKSPPNEQRSQRASPLGTAGRPLVPEFDAAIGLGEVPTASSLSGDSDRAPNQKKTKASTMKDYFVPALTREQVAHYEQCLVEFIVDSANPFQMVERGSWKRLVNSLRPGAWTIVTRRQTGSERLLPERYALAVAARDSKIQSLSENGHYVGLIVDGWESVKKKSLEGVILKAGTDTFLLSVEQPGAKHHGIAVATMWEGILNGSAHPTKTVSDTFSLMMLVSAAGPAVFWLCVIHTWCSSVAGLTR